MQPVPNLNKSTGRLDVAEAHALACWAALERHVTPMAGHKGAKWCGCYKHEIAGHIVVHKSCEVGEACAEEYEIASRRVREIKAESILGFVFPDDSGLEAGDMGSTLEQVRS